MEPRLIPINTLIALCSYGDAYPPVLANAGYELAGVEVPQRTESGTVVIDVVAFRPDRNVILAGEAKSGANVEEAQARRYAQLQADAVIQSTAIRIREPGDRQIQPLYCCPVEKVDRVLRGLEAAEVECPILAFSNAYIEHYGGEFIDEELGRLFEQPVPVPGPPPRIIPVDTESPDRLFDDLVVPALVAALSLKLPEMSLPMLAEQAIPHLAIYANAARKQLIKKVDAAARRAADRDNTRFGYLRRSATREHAVVRFLKSPEDTALQGRTQGYQAIARAHGKTPQDRRAPGNDQLRLFYDLTDEAEKADDESAERDDKK